MQDYLQRFGYLKSKDEYISGFKIDWRKSIESPAEKGVFDDNTEKALKLYQYFYRIRETGVLDYQTLKLMLTPRCGCPDIVYSKRTDPYYAIAGKWNKIALCYKFENYTSDLNRDDVRRNIQRAITEWDSIITLRLTEVSDPTADITLRWASID